MSWPSRYVTTQNTKYLSPQPSLPQIEVSPVSKVVLAIVQFGPFEDWKPGSGSSESSPMKMLSTGWLAMQHGSQLSAQGFTAPPSWLQLFV